MYRLHCGELLSCRIFRIAMEKDAAGRTRAAAEPLPSSIAIAAGVVTAGAYLAAIDRKLLLVRNALVNEQF
jgi:hypothetical protein